MMSNLPQLPAMAGAKAPAGAEESPLPAASQGKGESFASLISQAVTSNHSSSKGRDSGGKTSSNNQAKPEATSGLPVLDAAMMLGAGFAMPVIPPSAPLMTKAATGSAQAGANTKVLTSQGKAEVANTAAAAAQAGKVNSANVASEQTPDIGTDQAGSKKSLAAALGLQSITETANDAVAKEAVGASGLEGASPEVGNPQSGIGMVAEPKEASSPNDSGISSAAKIGVSSAGTPIAKSTAAMKKPEQTNRIAEASGKFLPSGSMSSGLKNDAFAQAGNLSATAVSTVDSGGDAGRAVAAEAVPVSGDTGTRTVERTHELVVQNAMRLSNATMESLQVVIKPDSGTQLSLELRQRGDGVEVQAVLHQGDFNQLNQNWSDLQQQLQQRGIQLGDLTNGSDFSGNGNGYWQQGANGEAGNLEAQGSMVAAVTTSGTASGGSTEKVAALAGSGGWQTWA